MKKVVLLLALLSTAILSQTNVTFLSNLNEYSSFGYSNIWGYVDPLGNEYALLGTGNGTSIISLADPTNPVECAFIPAPQSAWRELKVWSHYAYVATDATGNGLQIIDLSQLPTTATLVNTLNTYFNDCHDLLIDDGYCYTVGGDGVGGLRILDLLNPVIPVQTAYYTGSGYIHDIYIWNDTVCC
ncbi:MAG: choice-of-anchor B family protein [Ignavibacteriaceae bacterium]|nr:choice-of-anchor B family protein [Ignavibacteriaceae bacterium]